MFYWERVKTFRITRNIFTLSPPPYYVIFLYKGRAFSFLEIGLLRNVAHFLENKRKKIRSSKGIVICLWRFSKCGSFLLCHKFISAVGMQPANRFLKHQWAKAHKKNPSVSMESISAAVVKKDKFFSRLKKVCQIATDQEDKCAKGKIQDQCECFYGNVTHTIKKAFHITV